MSHPPLPPTQTLPAVHNPTQRPYSGFPAPGVPAIPGSAHPSGPLPRIYPPAAQPGPQMMVPLRYEFHGRTLDYIVHSLLAGLLTAATFGLGLPWAVVILHKWTTENTTVNGQPMRFTGSGGDLFGQYIKWWLLTIITLGIYGFAVPVRMQKWITEHQEGLSPIHPAPAAPQQQLSAAHRGAHPALPPR